MTKPRTLLPTGVRLGDVALKRLYFIQCCAVLCLSWRVASAQQQQPPSNPLRAAATGILALMDREILASKKKAAEALEKVLKNTTKKGILAAPWLSSKQSTG